jgi:hypothetical protein
VTVTEETLPDALNRLYKAVGRLVDEEREFVDGRLFSSPSLYEALADAVSGTKGGDQSRNSALGPRPPCWMDALDQRTQIDDTVQAWAPRERGSTVQRLRALAARKWAPHEVKQVEQIAAAVESWAVAITTLLDPEPIKHFRSVPCPSCNATTVKRRNSSGELVNQPALQIVAEKGCTCQACKATWAQDQYLFLCKVLGFGLPDGVLE